MKKLNFLLFLFCFSLSAMEQEFRPLYLTLDEKVAEESPLKIAEQLQFHEKIPVESGMAWGKFYPHSKTKGFYLYLNTTDMLQIKGYTVLNGAGIRSKDGLAMRGQFHPRINFDFNVTTNDIFTRTKQSYETSLVWKY